jgi:hypothetical protein
MLTARELALAAAIVFAFCAWFVDRQLLFAVVEAFR